MYGKLSDVHKLREVHNEEGLIGSLCHIGIEVEPGQMRLNLPGVQHVVGCWLIKTWKRKKGNCEQKRTRIYEHNCWNGDDVGRFEVQSFIINTKNPKSGYALFSTLSSYVFVLYFYVCFVFKYKYTDTTSVICHFTAGFPNKQELSTTVQNSPVICGTYVCAMALS